MKIEYTDESVCKGLDMDMIREEKRIESFKNWPFKTGSCTKEKMARTGFYFCNIKGEPDSVRCFFCLHCLDDWKQQDDPHEEHLKCNPDCTFARLNKDQDNLTVEEFSKVVQERDIRRIKKKFEEENSEYNDAITKLEELIRQNF